MIARVTLILLFAVLSPGVLATTTEISPDKTPTLTVTGFSELRVPADELQLTVGATATTPALADARQDVDERLTAIAKALAIVAELQQSLNLEQGGEIGPDLTAYQREELDAMLLSIINPSAEIREGYENFLLTTNGGRLATGFLVEQGNRLAIESNQLLLDHEGSGCRGKGWG